MRHSVGCSLVVLLAMLAAGCGGTKVRPVTYRLSGYVGGPVDHGTVKDGRQAFAQVFCDSLQHLIATGEAWGDCRNYIETESAITPTPPADLKPVRLLVVPGIFGECLDPTGVKAFLDAKHHFARHHPGVIVEHVTVSGLGTSRANAEQIRDYVIAHPGDAFIAVGHSKGSLDWMEAIAAYSEVRQKTLALATVASPIGGSRLPDLFGPDFIDFVTGVLRQTGLPDCHVSDGGGLVSLTRPDRQAFLRKYPVGAVPAYSVAAVATGDSSPGKKDRTISKVLELPWKKLHAYSLDEDSQVIADDAVVPGGTFLGIARADHWAVALPFELTTDPRRRRKALEAVDRDIYPRTALLEAIIHTVQMR